MKGGREKEGREEEGRKDEGREEERREVEGREKEKKRIRLPVCGLYGSGNGAAEIVLSLSLLQFIQDARILLVDPFILFILRISQNDEIQ